VSTTPGLHDLRHFYASGLIVAGCDLVAVQRALGHQSAVVTLSTYGHLWPIAEDRTRAAAASLMASATHAATSNEGNSALLGGDYTLNLNSTTSPSDVLSLTSACTFVAHAVSGARKIDSSDRP
jgi:hypothetical protein